MFDLRDCDESDFLGSDAEKSYYKYEIAAEGRSLICLPKEARDLVIEGNIQSAKAFRKRNSYMSL